jgi:hypothetical protein
MSTAFGFLLEVLELTTNETTALVRRNQRVLNDILTSAKIGQASIRLDQL